MFFCLVEESIGFEPMHQFLDDSLANYSFNRSGNSPCNMLSYQGSNLNSFDSKSNVLPITPQDNLNCVGYDTPTPHFITLKVIGFEFFNDNP